ncbi:uncharacterized protein J8A68_004265 [[Candida] subhashii]|uniref:Dipeptidyl aminopeptidase B n=1 Tax=[Candida] subhashii TaxID=561895 RepID=A0A8J5UVJ8_9ASCO|nr:uncharacterized protein J8A68_004265 [[Candida] subhashii]KAG7662255.1 hypothetical protein J8A68_004265 [[Candida] subhashii]
MTFYGHSDWNGSARPRQGLFKNCFYFGIVLASLVWGSLFLLYTIENFQTGVQLQHNVNRYSSPCKKRSVSGEKMPLSREAFHERLFVPITEKIRWIDEPRSIYNDQGTFLDIRNEDDDEFRVAIKSVGNKSYEYPLVEQSTFQFNNIVYKIEDLEVSPDLQKLVLKTNTTKTSAHASLALFWLMDIKTKKIQPLYYENEQLSAASWSLDSSHVTFVYKNNIFLKNIVDDKITQITSDGSSQIYNGNPDSNSVFNGDIVLWWSPNGKKFAFLRSNTIEVPDYLMQFFVQPGFEEYPKSEYIKYPKAGFSNPIVDILVYDLSIDNLTIYNLNSTEITPENRLLTEVTWVGDSLLVKTSNRASDLLEIYLINQEQVDLVRSVRANNSWFDITRHTMYIPKNKTMGREFDGYLDTIVEGGYNHLAYFSPPSNPNGQLLTKGNWEVAKGVEGFDHNTNSVYFTSNMKSSIERHVHAVDLLDRSNDGMPYIRNITNNDAWYECSFSSGARFIYLSYGGPGIPNQRIEDLTGQINATILEDNHELRRALQGYDIPKVRYETVELKDDETGEVFMVNAMERLPLNFDRKKKYPVVFHIYGGPGSQEVTKKWAISARSMIAAELNAVVVTIDGRGTGFNNLNAKMGSKFKFIVRDKLGQYEPLDVIAAGRNWAERSYVDPERIAVWGSSFGGYLTLKTLEADTQDPVFSYGFAMAPVTNWTLYDSVYTGRYMHTPQENQEGFRLGAVNAINLSHVKRFLIGHGTADDNVHVQHSYQLLDQLNLDELENYDFIAFPDSSHRMKFDNAYNLYHRRILDFFRRAFDNRFV